MTGSRTSLKCSFVLGRLLRHEQSLHNCVHAVPAGAGLTLAGGSSSG